jgi:hypothetical protein
VAELKTSLTACPVERVKLNLPTISEDAGQISKPSASAEPISSYGGYSLRSALDFVRFNASESLFARALILPSKRIRTDAERPKYVLIYHVKLRLRLV